MKRNDGRDLSCCRALGHSISQPWSARAQHFAAPLPFSLAPRRTTHRRAMFSKKKRSYEPSELPPSKRLRANLQDAFASNQLSGQRTQEIINDINACGVQGVAPTRTLNSHTARNLKRGFLKRSLWPQQYKARIRVLHKITKQEDYQECAFLLPHEILQALLQVGDHSTLASRTGMDPKTLEHLEKSSADHADGRSFLGVGLWSDGIPVNWDRTESVECVTMSLPGLTGKYKNLRIPLVAVSRKQVSEHTMFDIMSVLQWSLAFAGAGVWPNKRHDSAEWTDKDSYRRRRTGNLSCRAALVEMRGDWMMFASVMGFPAHSTATGMCWLCNATPSQAGNQNKKPSSPPPPGNSAHYRFPEFETHLPKGRHY
jgi:hypothetical protein